MLSGKGIIIDHATETDTFDITVAMGTATATDLSTLTINTTRITTADEIVISNGAATAALTLTGADGIMNDFDTGSGGDTLTGGSVNDDLDGAGGADIISGGAGDDIIIGGAGADVLTGGAGADSISGDAGADTLTGGAGGDTYVYDTGDVVSGETIVEVATDTGTDVVSVVTTTDFTALTAESLDNIEQLALTSGQTATFTGAQITAENFEVKGAGGTEGVVVNMGFGETLTLASLTFATFTSGTDTLTVNGTGGNETITGTANVDTIASGAGNDVITGGDGADIINIGAGTDTVVIVDSGAGLDVITGFGAGAGGDVIRLDLSGMEQDASGNQDGELIQLSESATGTVETTDTVVLTAITGATDSNTLAANTTILVANLGANIANDTALVAALDTSGGLELKADGELTAKDMFLALYDDGTHSYLAHVEVDTTVADDAKIGNGGITSTTIVKFDSVANCASFHADNFTFIA